MHEKKSEKLKENNRNLYDILNDAKEKNKQILEMVTKIESQELKKNIKEINQTINKIISTIEKKPEKYKQMGNEHFLKQNLLSHTAHTLKEKSRRSTSSLTGSCHTMGSLKISKILKGYLQRSTKQ